MDDKSGDNFSKEDMRETSSNNNLSLKDYGPNALEVSSRDFEAAHGQKYQEPANFLQALLWNVAGPLVESMKIQPKMMRSKFEGELASVSVNTSSMPTVLIDYLTK